MKKTKRRLEFPEIHEDDILDWDVCIPAPPPKKSGTIKVRLVYKGRSKPLPVHPDDIIYDI